MTHKKYGLILLISFLACGLASQLSAQQENVYNRLRQQFQDPPTQAWPKTYWWWLNGNIDTVRMKEEIAAMNRAGLSGFDIFEIGAPRSDTIIPTGEITFMGDDFLRAMKVALDQAAVFDMEVGLNLASSWNAGGAWITPEYAAKSIYYARQPFTGKGMQLAFPRLVRGQVAGKIQLGEDKEQPNIPRRADGKPAFYREIAVLAIPRQTGATGFNPGQVLDLSEYFDPTTERLNWSAPGDYDIYRFVCSNSGELLKLPSRNSNGYIIDHFDAGATAFHFNYIIDRLRSVWGDDLAQSPLKSLYLASYEALGTVWTESLPEKFRNLHGYDIAKYLPIIFDKSLFPEAVNQQFQRDLQYTLSELMIDNFYRKAKAIANANGLKINSESGGPGFPLHNVPVEPLKSLGVMDLPRGEFWINHNRLNKDGIDVLRVVKEVSAASHIYGRGIVEEEAFTTFQHWQESPAEMKPMGDRAFCEGMNKVVVHGSSHNPSGLGDPGIVYYAGTHYNDKRVWWPMVRPFNNYLARLSNVFQQTDFVADVLYFYGSAVPNFAGHKNSRFFVGHGYDYEVTNTEILLQASVEKGKIKLPNGAVFALLAIEPEPEMAPEVFAKLRELAAAGARIVAERPKGVFPRESLPKIRPTEQEIDALWAPVKAADKNVLPLTGKVLSGIQATELLPLLGIGPDLVYDDSDFGLLDFIHYQKEGTDYYLLRNTTDQWISRQCSFRQTAKIPELWEPVSGQVSPIPVYQTGDAYTSLPLSLPPFGSALIVFKRGTASPAYSGFSSGALFPPLLEYHPDGMYFLEPGRYTLQMQNGDKTITNYIREEPLTGSWEVFFPEGKGAPERAIFPALIPWSESAVEGIRYFSGIARYVKTFQFDRYASTAAQQRIFLELGELSNIAEVRLNGELLGISWTKPHRFDITERIRNGDNLLEVSIANTWNNRLKGDAVTGTKHTFTNIRTTDIAGLNKIDVAWKDVPLLRSGLLGPVKIISLVPVR